jgi:hypothetical protein
MILENLVHALADVLEMYPEMAEIARIEDGGRLAAALEAAEREIAVGLSE